jgi:GT2 family glycosyltransferase/glycosyltransferase involved in cell wall biosynthesis
MKPVDIVIPVYNAPDDLAACVASVLAHTQGEYQLVLIDDASPDARIAELFAQYTTRGLPQLKLLRNAMNVGFTGTANRGMTLSRNDVVLLNSDTLVTPGWLEALRRCAASDPRIGTVTPFSNNAEICSFPRFCANNAWDAGRDPAPVAAALAAAAVPTYPDLPTGVGFCFYVRRALIEDIGGFDAAFGAGYGEENDFCLRAAAHEWRNVLCDDAFVVHTGGRSFVDLKHALVPTNTATLLARHPGYAAMVQGYVAADSLRPLRDVAQSKLAQLTGPRHGVLHIIHHHGGGTESHVRTLIGATLRDYRHYLAVAVGDHWQLEEHRADGTRCVYPLARGTDETWPGFLRGLCATFAIGLIHLHNLSACRDGIMAALEGAGIPWGYTVHDESFACPTITLLDAAGRYCGAVTDTATCATCLAAQPEHAGVDIARWRARHQKLASGAAFVIAPSQWAADTFTRYFGCEVNVIPHGVAPAVPAADRGARVVVLLPEDEQPTVVVLGAVGPDKGARRLERLVELARSRNVAMRFVLIGYLDREHGPWQSADARFTVHGRYAPTDLPALFRHYRARLVLYPSAGPETFSYTLSEAWAAGLPVMVPPIGALAERVRAQQAGFVLTPGEWSDDTAMFERLVSVVGATSGATPAAAHRGDADALATAATRARAARQPTLAGMAAATLALYRTVDVQGPTGAAWPARRLRDALGYHPWLPPEPPADVLAARRSMRGKLAAIAKRLRRTELGGGLHDRLPARWTEALRARLR